MFSKIIFVYNLIKISCSFGSLMLYLFIAFVQFSH